MKFKIAFGKKDYERAIVKAHLREEDDKNTLITDEERMEAFNQEVASLEELGFQFTFYVFDLRKDYYEKLLECQVEDFQKSMEYRAIVDEGSYDIKMGDEHIKVIAGTVSRMKCKGYEVKNEFALKCYNAYRASINLINEYILTVM